MSERLICVPTSRYSDNGTCEIVFAPLSSSGSMTESDIWLAEERKTRRRERHANTRETFPSPGNTLYAYTFRTCDTKQVYPDGRRDDIPYLLTSDSRAWIYHNQGWNIDAGRNKRLWNTSRGVAWNKQFSATLIACNNIHHRYFTWFLTTVSRLFLLYISVLYKTLHNDRKSGPTDWTKIEML